MKRNIFEIAKGPQIKLLYRGLNPGGTWHNLVESHIRKLQHLAAIISAKIILERDRHSKPEFRVSAVLEVPGPDFHAAASDYTLRAALGKLAENLRRQMQSRRNRQIDRRRGKAGRAFLKHLNLLRV
jgi:ribosomal subunit interface protein